MNAKPLAALLLGALVSSCASSSHWNSLSAVDRITYQFTGYRGPIDGNVFSFIGAEMATMGVTTVRHFFNYDPENPFQSGSVERGAVPTPPSANRFKVKNDRSPQRVF